MRDAEVIQLVAAANDGDGRALRGLVGAFRCDERLAVYGTLAPGECNHGELAGCPGEWTAGAVRGRRAVRAFPVFTYDPAAPFVPVQVLDSPALARNWPRIDDFEGPDYRRIVVPVFQAELLTMVAQLYAARVPVPAAPSKDPPSYGL
jgi:gamma-glutamylcyclotransferase (GGCT)/AIG2-like uncharacterized protein YtfP